jgi:NAD(P)-dependent dehydrogenase (short-subunit alcohol dehydrogenase family)
MTSTGRDLEGKVAIVTGAGNPRGIGMPTARALAAAGARVVVADVAQSAVAESAALLVGEGFDVVARTVDISSEAEVEALIAFVREGYGRLDVLDNNAASQGHGGDALVADMTVELWDLIMGVNARGTMLMCKHALPLMIAGGGGSIINISSGTAHAGDFYATAYAASKGAINTFTKYVATQYGPQGIRCNAVAPGIIQTAALAAGMPPAMQAVFRDHSLTGILGRPEDIAEMVVYLASDRARFISGQIIPVDGGIYAHVPTAPAVKALFDKG